MSEHDERIVSILKTVANSPLCSEDYCLYDNCGATYPADLYPLERHDATCPVVLARAILAEWGMPLLLFEVSYERNQHRNMGWYPITRYELAFSLSEAVKRIAQEDAPTLPGTHIPEYRNITGALIGEVQEILKRQESEQAP